MSVKTLCVTLRKLTVSRIGTVGITAARCYATQHTNRDVFHFSNGVPPCATDVQHAIKFKPGTLNVDFGIPVRPSIQNIIEMPITKIPPLQEPVKRVRIEYDIPVLGTSIDLPTCGNTFEKQAKVGLVVIRRRKMKKHKRKKLRKKLKFILEKIRTRRNILKEKKFQNELVDKIKEAQAFDAKNYVQEKLHILNKERIPRTYRGEILPLDMIKNFLDEKKARQEAKRNKPRLTL